MTGECYYCRGIVLPDEPGDVVLDGHSDHRVFMHLACGAGQNIVERADDTGEVTVVCPECGDVETRQSGVLDHGAVGG